MTPIDSDSRHPKSAALIKKGSLFTRSRKEIRLKNIPWKGHWWNTWIGFRKTYRELAYDFKKRTSPDRWYGSRESASPGVKPKK